ncbi:MAG: DoxX family protein [Solirubrobacteraceae bacterium]|nr:DoxX family protein [Solirubrobacteraceae bacterium]
MTWSQRLLAVFFTAAGALHFVRPGMYEEIMPDYVPAHHELVLASGAAEIAGALGVIAPRTRRLAGFWLAATLVAVFPANVHMALHPDRYPGLSPALLWGRLALQPLAIWWALAATRPARDAETERAET